MRLKHRSIFVRLLVSNMVLVVVSLLVANSFFSYLVQSYYSGLREWRARTSIQKVGDIVTDVVNDEDLVDIDVSGLAETLDALSDSAGMEIGIVDRNARPIVYSSNIHEFDLHLDPRELEALLDGSSVTRRIKGPRTSHILMALPILNRRENAGSIRLGSASSRDDFVMGAVVIQAPLANIGETIHSILELIAYSSLVALPAALIVSLVLARHITDPLIRLKKAAMRVAEGRYQEVHLPKRSTDEMEHLVRTFNYAVRRTRDTFEESKRLAQMRKQFTDDISHELRIPLTSIKAYLELLLDSGVSAAKAKRYCETMLKDAEYLIRLSEDLVLLGKMESTDISLAKTPTDIVSIIENALKSFQARVDAKELTIVRDISEPMPKFNVDGDAIHRAILNLLDNAIAHSPRGGTVRVCVFPTTDDRKSSNFGLEVEDRGPGIPEDITDRVWQRFYKADTSRTRTGSAGSGLGLSIVKAIVERHGGHVTLRRPQRGGVALGFVLDASSNAEASPPGIEV